MLKWNKPTKRTIILALFSALTFTTVHAKGEPQSGNASYYSYEFNKRKTASGELFNPEALTCAHRTLKFGTILKVTNLRNGEDVLVRVNDRGPFIQGRIIDLSLGAAKKIKMLKTGTAKVSIEIVKKDLEKT